MKQLWFHQQDKQNIATNLCFIETYKTGNYDLTNTNKTSYVTIIKKISLQNTSSRNPSLQQRKNRQIG